MKLHEIEATLKARTPVHVYSPDGWPVQGWHDATVAGIDSDKEHPRVWLNVGRSGQIVLESKKDIGERLRIKEHINVDR